MRTTYTDETASCVGTGTMRPVSVWGLVCSLVVAAVTMVVLPPVSGWTQAFDQTQGAETLVGEITGKPVGDTIQVDGRNVLLHNTVTIMDDEGRPRAKRDLEPGLQVRCEFRQGQIRAIVIVLPK